MSETLLILMRQAETLTPEEQLQLIAHLTQQLQPEAVPQPSTSHRPIWKRAQAITADLSEAELAQLPIDGSEQHDHYIYGTPKRE